jgi:DNA-directed RNA polymerase specialized sigma24 family protein
MAIRAGEKEAYTGLLKHLFAVLDNEVASSRQFGEFVSLDAPVEPDAQDVAEAMVEEEIFEFYQPDDTLKLADIFAGSQHPDVATIAEQEELIDRSSEFAFAFDLLKDMPRLWRRIFLLIRVDGLNASSVSEILLIPSKEDAVRRWLMQAEAFIAAHLEEAGVSKRRERLAPRR